MASIGINIRENRKKRGLTQKQLADRLFVTQQAIAGWESCARIPETSRIPDIAKALECSIDDILSGTTPPDYQQEEPMGEYTFAALEITDYRSAAEYAEKVVGKYMKEFPAMTQIAARMLLTAAVVYILYDVRHKNNTENIRSVVEVIEDIQIRDNGMDYFFNNPFSIDSEGLAASAYLAFAHSAKDTRREVSSALVTILYSLCFEARVQDPDLEVPDHRNKSYITFELMGGHSLYDIPAIVRSHDPKNLSFSFPFANVREWQMVIEDEPVRESYVFDGWYQQDYHSVPDEAAGCGTKIETTEERVDFVRNGSDTYPKFYIPESIQNRKDHVTLCAHWTKKEVSAEE